MGGLGMAPSPVYWNLKIHAFRLNQRHVKNRQILLDQTPNVFNCFKDWQGPQNFIINWFYVPMANPFVYILSF